MDLGLACRLLFDEAPLAAASRTLVLLSAVRPANFVVACFTRGSPAQLELPSSDITFEDLARTADVHDVTSVFVSLDRAGVTGTTRTNVNDLRLFIIAP
jgi:glycerate-2-kinase